MHGALWLPHTGSGTQLIRRACGYDLCPQSRWVHVAVTHSPATGQGSIFWDGNIQMFGNMPTPLSITRSFHFVGASLTYDLGLSALGEGTRLQSLLPPPAS